MRKLFTLATLVKTICCFAQDIIVTNKAQKIDAKILEVTSSEIRYKELDNLGGPIFILRTDEINSIIYANGKVVLYNYPHDLELENAEHAKQAEAIAKANQLGSLFGNSGNENSVEHKGKHISRSDLVMGNSWALMGRGIRGTLPKPVNSFNQEGSVIVEIRVNAAGDVVAVSHKGGTVNDKQTIQLALDAARKAKFTEGEHDQIGTITYNFKFN